MKVWRAVAVAVVAVSAPVQAQTPGDVIVEDEELACEHHSTLDFDSGSARINLESEASLNAALTWLFESPERYLFILGPDGPTSADRRLGQVRVQSVITFLLTGSAAPRTIISGDFSALSTSRRRFQLRASNVAVMACELAPVVTF
jgi:hypothetical protein